MLRRANAARFGGMLGPMSTAALVVIGDEILSGKVTDTNTPFLIGELRDLGVRLCEIAVVADETAAIAEAVRRVSGRFNYVFTSGGVGPTHDDVTMAGIAAAFDLAVIRHPRLEEMLRGYYAGKGLAVVERNLRMADVPDGAELVESEHLAWPVLRSRNVYILPGIPEIFRKKFLAIREIFREKPFHLRLVYSRSEEGVIAQHLDAIAAKYPDVALGSYPRWQPADDGHRVKLTLEGKELARVEEAAADLSERLGLEHLVAPGV